MESQSADHVGDPSIPGHDQSSVPAQPDVQPSVPDEPSPAVSDESSPAVPVSAVGRRSERKPKDMALSLLVLLAPIALLFGFSRIFFQPDEPAVVDTASVIAQARAANAFPVSEPIGLGSGWRTVSARYQPADGAAVLRIGYLSPDGQGMQVVQSNLPPEKLLPTELTDASRPQGSIELAGQRWQRHTARPGERALVLLMPNRTVIVVGAAGEEELRELAGALR